MVSYTSLLINLYFLNACVCDEFLMGYITGSERRPNEQEYSRPGLSISGAISLAVDEINSQHPIKQGHSLGFVVAETFGEEEQSILNIATLWTQNVSVYIGPQESCVHEARMASAFNLPMISYFCARYETSDKAFFPTFARTRPPDMHISKSVASVLLTFGWKKVAFLYSSAKEFDFHDIADTIVKTLDVCDIRVMFRKTWDVTYHHGYLENPFLKLVEETYLSARIYVILGQYYEHLGLMVTMEKKGLFNLGEYFVVGVDIEQYDVDNPGMYLRGLLKDETEDVAQKAYQSYLGVIGSPPTGFEEFSIKVNDYMEKEPFNYPNPLTFLGGRKRIRSEAAYLYDAVYIYARALNQCVENDEDPFNGRTIFDYVKGHTYKSAMGYMVHMDENGDAEGNYTLVARKPIPYTSGQYGLFPIGMFVLSENDSIPLLQLNASIDWIGSGPPIDEPVCGFLNELCYTRTPEIVAGIAGGILLSLLIIFLIAYRNWKYEQELDSLLWKIDFKEIKMKGFTPQNITGNYKTSRMVHPVIRASQVSLSSNPDVDFRYSTIYTQIAFYKGQICAVRRVRKKTIDITRKMKKELKIMRDLHHDNLITFIGACVDPPNICVITEYCARGSLKDILDNDDVKLDQMFIASLVDDIIRGMIYLHDSPIRSHGRLQSSNCLVDSRWVLKIADFGLHDFIAGAELAEDSNPQTYYENLLYRAPEILRDPNSYPCGTQKGDVYSFGILLYEIHSRQGPFGAIDMTPQEILKRVIDGKTATRTLFRPQSELMENTFDYVKNCLKECWNELPEDRPDFKAVRQKMRPLRKGMRSNILDNMIVMMEKYANNLESLVDEKADQLIEEKRKTDALLHEMLPRYVIEQLKCGKQVEAESFDSVTIYFSDIVGFTAMSAESTPLEVVDFLNDLYTCFDSIIENYDVYKVETIGDAYMVVSGLPIRNGDSHAGEIASMSLHLLDAVRKFKIRHRPFDTLKLRIGIHTGPVCAGVVGLKMPRYCLFGDTVNTASRMESHGLPLRIHCSSQSRETLEKLGGYQVEERGFVNMKGKGDVKTYWLVGEDENRREQRIRQRCMRISSLRGGFALSWTEKQLNCASGRNRTSFYNSAIIVGSENMLTFDTYDSKNKLEAEDNEQNGLLKHRRPISCPCISDILSMPSAKRSSDQEKSSCSLFTSNEIVNSADCTSRVSVEMTRSVTENQIVNINSGQSDVDKETPV